MDKKRVDQLELDEDYIVLLIPSTTCEVTITAKVFYEGELVTVTKVMNFDEVREAFTEAANGYIPEDTVFTITDKGKEALGISDDDYGTGDNV